MTKLYEALSFSVNLKLQCLQQNGLEATNFKLDWASGKSLTTTPSSLEYLLLTSIKEDLCLLSHLLTFNQFKTLFMGSKTCYLGS